jgi:hypothetical protein
MTINEILEEEKKKLDSWKIFCNVEERMHGRISKSTLRDKEILEFKVSILEELIQYRSIGTVEECRAAVEKQSRKKPNIAIGQTDEDKLACCPICEGNLDWTYNGFWRKGNPKYCSNCGQKLDWDDTP